MRSLIFATIIAFGLAVSAQALQSSTLEISSVPVVTVQSPTTAVVSWTTSVPSDSFVFYGLDGGFGHDNGVSDQSGVTAHSQTITGLWPGSTYSFGVRSRVVVRGVDNPSLTAFYSAGTFTMPAPSASGAFDYWVVPEGPHHVVQSYDIYSLLSAGFVSGTSNFKYGSYKVIVQNLPPHTTIHWPDQEYNGLGQGARSSTFASNDTITFWAPFTTEFQLVTNVGGTTPPGTYTLNLKVTTLLADGSAGPQKALPWTVAVEAAPSFPSGNISSYPPIPGLSVWQSSMTTYGAGHWCNQQTLVGEACAPGYEQCSWYYDGERVFYQIADYTNNPAAWDVCALNSQANYRDQYVLAQSPIGAIPGWRVFPDGIYMNYLRTGDALSKTAVDALATNAAGARMWASQSPFVTTGWIREASYLFTSNRLDNKLGNDRSRQMQQMASVVLGQVDQITSGEAAWTQPFMDGLAAEALIHYYEDGHQDDVRVPAAIKTLADWLWINAWQPAGNGECVANCFYYNSYQHKIGLLPGSDERNLNLLVAPMYAWLYKMTGDSKYQIEGDAIFAAGVNFDPAGTLGWSGKNFSQQYRWSFDFVGWRGNR